MEKIQSAAIKYRIKGEHNFKYVSGCSHANCIEMFSYMDLYPNHRDMEVEEQGFFTTEGRFVNRRMAKDIALKASQIPVNYNKSDLYSEYIDWEK